jgi:hypothetical protein
MKKSVWRTRLMLFGVFCMTLVSATGCKGLSDQQLSGMFQSVMTTGLSTLLQTIINAAAGTTP